jgi:hypothetical protein
MPPERPNKSSAKFLTYCPDCQHEVGAAQDRFNKTGLDAEVWRRARHHYQGRLCFGSRNVISENTVWPAPARDALVTGA